MVAAGTVVHILLYSWALIVYALCGTHVLQAGCSNQKVSLHDPSYVQKQADPAGDATNGILTLLADWYNVGAPTLDNVVDELIIFFVLPSDSVVRSFLYRLCTKLIDKCARIWPHVSLEHDLIFPLECAVQEFICNYKQKSSDGVWLLSWLRSFVRNRPVLVGTGACGAALILVFSIYMLCVPLPDKQVYDGQGNDTHNGTDNLALLEEHQHRLARLEAACDELHKQKHATVHHLSEIKKITDGAHARIDALERGVARTKQSVDGTLERMCTTIEQTRKEQKRVDKSFFQTLQAQAKKVDDLRASITQSLTEVRSKADAACARVQYVERDCAREQENYKDTMLFICQSLDKQAALLQSQMDRYEHRVARQEKYTGKVHEKITEVNAQVASIKAGQHPVLPDLSSPMVGTTWNGISSAVSAGKALYSGMNSLGGWITSRFTRKKNRT